jgi:hypothetical protein
MRDGIPRALPVLPKWRAFVECLDRPADRGTDQPVARLRDAIHDSMRRELPDAGRQSVEDLLNQSQPSLPGLETNSECHLARGQGHRLGEALRESRVAIASGVSPKAAVCQAVMRQMKSLTAAIMRQIDQNLAGQLSPADFRRFISDRNQALSAIDFTAETERFLNGSALEDSKISKKNLPDEDLRGRR